MSFAGSLAACAGGPWLGNSGHSGQLPIGAVVLGPNETTTLNVLPTQVGDHFCSTGAVLQCERFGVKLRCSCPAIPGQ